MKDYTLTEAKYLLQKYFCLLPKSLEHFTNEICGETDCDDCLFNVHDEWGCSASDFLNPEMIAKAEQYVKDHEQKVDWSKVPAGTPVLCWYGNDVPDGYESKRLFLAEAMGKLWSLDIGNKNRAEAWEHMKLADFDKSEK